MLYIKKITQNIIKGVYQIYRKFTLKLEKNLQILKNCIYIKEKVILYNLIQYKNELKIFIS